jgi:type IV secretion system protein VirB1
MDRIVRVESAYRPLRIGINGPHGSVLQPRSVEEAVSWAQQLLTRGENIDLGLAQINSRNLSWLGLSVADAFDTCRNLQAASQVLSGGYRAALKASPSDRSLLQTAYSLYNTGNMSRGLRNGYVERLEGRR